MSNPFLFIGKFWKTTKMSRHLFTTLSFDNQALKRLPVDNEKINFVRQVEGACFSIVKPTPVKNPKMLIYSKSAMELLDLSEKEMDDLEAATYFSGNKLLPGAEPAAHCYCGHQFGSFAGQLGDGATMYLGEVVNKKNERWEIQFKGAGLTPFSRQADGRKVLRSSLREFLCSEAIHNLNIPTTRAGTCVTSDTLIVRDVFYNGNPKNEKATVILRIAPTFIRFGSFEIFNGRNEHTGRTGPSHGKVPMLLQMLDYVVEFFYPEIWAKKELNREKKYLEFYRQVVEKTALLVAEWQCVGWCHGVLNTDNMSILGLTIDYGPFGFMDSFDPDFICNGSDDSGRYTYAKQPEICKWNCGKLAEALAPAVPIDETTKILEETFDAEFEKHYMSRMRQKLGFLKSESEDKALVEEFFEALQQTGGDFTNCWRSLSTFKMSDKATLVETLTRQGCSVEMLKKRYEPSMDRGQLQMLMQLAAAQPGILAMLGGSTDMLDREIAKQQKMEQFTDLTAESKTTNDRKIWESWIEKYAKRLGKEEQGSEAESKRVALMNSVNPRFILRNYIAEEAIKRAEAGDFSEAQRVLHLLENPFAESLPEPSVAAAAARAPAPALVSCSGRPYDELPPDWAVKLKVT